MSFYYIKKHAIYQKHNVKPSCQVPTYARNIMWNLVVRYQHMPENTHILHLASPIVPARTIIIHELMETVGIPHNNFSCSNLRNELGCQVAVRTNSKVFDHADRSPCPWSRIDEPKGNGQLLTVVAGNMFSPLLLHIVQHKVHFGHIHYPLHLPI